MDGNVPTRNESEPYPRRGDPPQGVAADAPPTTRHVLVAEDDPVVSEVVVSVLARMGYRTHRAAGPAALDTALSARVGLIVVGGEGGGVTAADMVLALRLGGDTTPVLILSAGDDPWAAGLAETDPTVRALAKPFGATELTRAVGELAGRPVESS